MHFSRNLRLFSINRKSVFLGIYEELQKEFKKKINEATSRILTLEEGLDRLSTSEYNSLNSENEIRQISEQLEIERKTFEDMEFQQMEENAHKETEREELLREISGNIIDLSFRLSASMVNKFYPKSGTVNVNLYPYWIITYLERIFFWDYVHV